MDVPKEFEWSYDRNPWDSKTEARTFSVGVYQWLPKASGKGLQKSTTIRVLGYVAEPEAVYDKARELCDQFNSKKVCADTLPAWVQKQYSVAEPKQSIKVPTATGR